ncbi:MAG: tyrosine-type recombinase/integrase [Bacteriovoracia bacterium]
MAYVFQEEGPMSFLPVTLQERAGLLVKTFLSSQGAATREAYRADLGCFQDFLMSNFNLLSLQPLLQMNSGEMNFLILQYRDDLRKRNFSPSTINRRLGAIRSLFKLARLLGFTSIKVEIPNIKSQAYRDTKGPGLPAFKRMIITATEQSSVKAARDRAILRLMFDLALRASELVELDLKHLEISQKRISIKGKGRSEREYLSIPQTSIDAVRDWIQLRGNADGPLFYNLVRDKRKRKRLTRVGLYELIRGLGEDVKVKTRPHGIRHLSISEACKVAQNNGYALEEVMDHSRHKSVATLMIYRDRERDTQGAISTLVSNTILDEDNDGKP